MKNKNEKKGNSKKISMLTAAERRAKFEASNHFQQTVKPYQVMREHLGSIGGCRAFILAMQKDLPEDAPAKLPARAVRDAAVFLLVVSRQVRRAGLRLFRLLGADAGAVCRDAAAGGGVVGAHRGVRLRGGDCVNASGFEGSTSAAFSIVDKALSKSF